MCPRRPFRFRRLCPALIAACVLLSTAPLGRAEVIMAPGQGGEGARMVVETGRVTQTAVGGELHATTEVGRLTQRAEGRDASAVTVIGRIQDVTTGGDLTNTVTLGTSLNIAIGAGARACTELGTLGGGFVCR